MAIESRHVFKFRKLFHDRNIGDLGPGAKRFRPNQRRAAACMPPSSTTAKPWTSRRSAFPHPPVRPSTFFTPVYGRVGRPTTGVVLARSLTVEELATRSASLQDQVDLDAWSVVGGLRALPVERHAVLVRQPADGPGAEPGGIVVEPVAASYLRNAVYTGKRVPNVARHAVTL